MKQIFISLTLVFILFFAGCSSTNVEQTEIANQIETQTQNDEVKIIRDNTPEETYDQVIEVDSFNFGYSREEIFVKKGQKVKIILTNSDGFHDFVVDELGVASAKINAGDTTEFIFTPEIVGEFEFYCSVGSHRDRGMVGKIIVEE